MALHFGLSMATIKRRLRKYGISLREVEFSKLKDAELKQHVEILLSAGHECGMLLSGWSLDAANFVVSFTFISSRSLPIRVAFQNTVLHINLISRH